MLEEFIACFKRARFVDQLFFCAGVAGVFICTAWLCVSLRGAGGGSDTDATIQAINGQQSGVSHQIGNADADIGNAQHSVHGAGRELSSVQGRLEESERAARNNAEQLRTCQKLAEDCRELARANKAILDGFTEANRQGKSNI